MIDASTNTLIQRVLDGDASPEERAALDALAADDPVIQTARADFEATVALLGRVEAVDPPADLKRRIMTSLPEGRYARAAARPVHAETRPARADGWSLATVFEALREALTARPAFGYAYAVAIGAIVGVAAYVSVAGTGPAPAPPDVYGTFVAPDAGAHPPGATYAIDLDDVGGTVRLASDGERLVLDLALTPQSETEVHLAFDPGGLRWRGLARLDGSGEVQTMPGAVRLVLGAPARYRLHFEGSPASLVLSLSQQGTTLYERVLSPRERRGERPE